MVTYSSIIGTWYEPGGLFTFVKLNFGEILEFGPRVTERGGANGLFVSQLLLLVPAPSKANVPPILAVFS